MPLVEDLIGKDSMLFAVDPELEIPFSLTHDLLKKVLLSRYPAVNLTLLAAVAVSDHGSVEVNDKCISAVVNADIFNRLLNSRKR